MIGGKDQKRGIGTEDRFCIQRAERDRGGRVAPERLEQVGEARYVDGDVRIDVLGMEITVAVGDCHQTGNVRQSRGAYGCLAKQGLAVG